MHRKNQEFIGVDVGDARVGLARGSSLARLAEPLKTVPAPDSVGQLAAAADVYSAAGIVVGRPRNLDGRETAQTKQVRDWAHEAKKVIKLPFYWQDEALTSRQAAAKLQTSNFKHQTIDEHAAAAAMILQDFLDGREDDRVAI